MVYIPYTDTQWAAIREKYFRVNGITPEERYSVRKIADWWATHSYFLIIPPGTKKPEKNEEIPS